LPQVIDEPDVMDFGGIRRKTKDRCKDITTNKSKERMTPNLKPNHARK